MATASTKAETSRRSSAHPTPHAATWASSQRPGGRPCRQRLKDLANPAR